VIVSLDPGRILMITGEKVTFIDLVRNSGSVYWSCTLTVDGEAVLVLLPE
jgi:hypothetical protein